MKRFLQISASIVLLLSSSVAIGVANELADSKQRPNVILIVLDDAAYSDFGVYGGEIETPNIDTLARDGMLFTQFHVTPNCSTTRASLLTGMDHHRTGIATHESLTENQQGQPGYEGVLNDRVATVAEVLQAGGYRTLMAGKWHVGKRKPESSWPSSRGFDRTFSLLGGMDAHYPQDLPILPSYPANYVSNGNLADMPEDFYSSDFYTEFVIQEIQQKPKEPFFAYLAFTAPHTTRYTRRTHPYGSIAGVMMRAGIACAPNDWRR